MNKQYLGKVACVGNMNNMGLPSCLYLKELGYDVTLFLLNEFDHFLPQNETDEPIDLKIEKLGWTEENFSMVDKKTIKSIFEPFDYIIGTDYAPAFLNKAGIRMNVFFPAGTDITQWPFKRSKRFYPKLWEYNYLACSISQYWGIKRAYFKAFDNNDQSFQELTSVFIQKNNQIPALPFHYLPFLHATNKLNDPILQKKKEEIDKFKFKIIQQSRQEWYSFNIEDDHYKGNDILIKGFAKFMQYNKIQDACLILLEYGGDVEHSKILIKQLQIEDSVIWLPKMSRKNLYSFIKLSDIGIGILGKSTVTNCSIYEIISLAKPIIQTRDDEYFKHSGFGELYPIYNVNNAQGVNEQIENAYKNHEYRTVIGKKAQDWILTKQEQRISGLIYALKNKKDVTRFNFELYVLKLKKPITRVLDKLEILLKIKLTYR